MFVRDGVGGVGDGNVRCCVILLSLMFVRDGVGGVGDGNVRCYVILLSLMLFVWDGVGGVGDGHVLCYVILLSLMFIRDGVGGVGDGNVRCYAQSMDMSIPKVSCPFMSYVYAWMWRRDCKQSLYKSLGDLCGNVTQRSFAEAILEKWSKNAAKVEIIDFGR